MKELSSQQIESLARQLYQRLGLELSNHALAVEALTHPSFSNETALAHPSYDRLEFLGDTVVNLVVGAAIFDQMGDADSGLLTQLRARIISQQGLHAIALNLGLGDLALLGDGEENSGGRTRSSTLADMVESVVGAVYLDKGFNAARTLILGLIDEQLSQVVSEGTGYNPKGSLQQEVLQRFGENPQYIILNTKGPDHDPIFTVEVLANGKPLGRGRGGSRRLAEEAAATKALKALKN